MHKEKVSIALVALGLLFAFTAHAQTTIQLLPQPGVLLLDHNCGGIKTSVYVTGFDSAGNITGDVYAWTRCGSFGRGGGYRTTLYQSWHSIVWDLNGVALSTGTYNGVAPDPLFTATDAKGNMIYTGVYPFISAYGELTYYGILVKP